MKKFFNNFQAFMTRGSAIDLAIGIIIGSAFTTVVNSIVDNLMMPPFGLLLSNTNFQDLFIILRQGEQPLPAQATLQMARDVGAVTFNYGQFLTDFTSFLILGMGVFLIIRGIQNIEDKVNRRKKDQEEATETSEKDCPFCFKSIHFEARRCPYCTSHLENQVKNQ